MAIQDYSTVASRNLIRAEGKMLKHAENRIVIGMFGEQKEQPLNKTDTVVFRRMLPFDAASNETPQIDLANFALSEGVVPDANTVDFTDVSATIQEFGVLYKFSNKTAHMYEDDIPGSMQKQCGETMGLVCEKIAYGSARGGTSVRYGNGTTRAGVNTAISIDGLRAVARTLEANYGNPVTSAIKPGPNFDTSPTEDSFIVFVHTDLVADIRDLPGFTKRIQYGTAIKPVHKREFGECEGFRFVTSPFFAPYLAAGSATLNGMKSAGSANVDIYPSVVIAEDALGHVALKGHGETAITPRLIPVTQINHANPLGQIGYVGASVWTTSVRLNENWMVRYETGASSLS